MIVTSQVTVMIEVPPRSAGPGCQPQAGAERPGVEPEGPVGSELSLRAWPQWRPGPAGPGAGPRLGPVGPSRPGHGRIAAAAPGPEVTVPRPGWRPRRLRLTVLSRNQSRLSLAPVQAVSPAAWPGGPGFKLPAHLSRRVT